MGNSSGGTFMGFLVAILIGLGLGYVVWESADTGPGSEIVAAQTGDGPGLGYTIVHPDNACGEWDDTSLGKGWSMRARTCATVKDGKVIARPQVQVDEQWGESFHRFSIETSIKDASGETVGWESCLLTDEANRGTNDKAFSWNKERLLCGVTVPAKGSEPYTVKVDVHYDLKGDFGAGTQVARAAEAVVVAAR